MTIEERLARLENQNRQLKWTLTGLVGVAVIGCAMGLKASANDSTRTPRAVPDVIRAERFEAIDPDGNALVVLGSNRDRTGGVVFVNNHWGRLVTQMGAADDGRGVVWAYDCDGYLTYGTP